MKLVKPSIERLPAYEAALKRGWSPDNLRPEFALEQIEEISQDAVSFVSRLDDPGGEAGPLTLPDGSKVKRLPSIKRWIFDDGFCGHIGLRWQPGTEKLPPFCSGHIGYGIVAWRRGEGLATSALKAFLPEAKALGLRFVEITTRPDNPASVCVIEKAGGQLIESSAAHNAIGGHDILKFNVPLG